MTHTARGARLTTEARDEWAADVNARLEVEGFALTTEEAEGYFDAGYTSDAAAAEIVEHRATAAAESRRTAA